MLHPSLVWKSVEWVSVHVYIEFGQTDPLAEEWDWPIQGPVGPDRKTFLPVMLHQKALITGKSFHRTHFDPEDGVYAHELTLC
jgi:hypothetical protein